MISIIACMDKNRGIGKNNSMPWHLPKELKHFKEITDGNIVVMGRKTYESIGKPLPNRINIVLSSSMDVYESQGIVVANTFDDLKYTLDYVEGEKFIIGGATLYEKFLPYADRLHMTHIDAEFDCDTFFPDLYAEDWNIVDYKLDEDKGYGLQYFVFDRNKKE